MKSHQRSGQILAVSALVIALVMISTATYIYDLSANIGGDETASFNAYAGSIVLGSRHVVLSALANITNGGDNETVAADLDLWKQALGRQYAFGTVALNYTLSQLSPYVSGLHFDWGTNASGVSEAYVDFAFNVTGRELKMQYPFFVYASTKLAIEGHLTPISSTGEQVTLVLNLSNEEQPALAHSIVILYRNSTAWVVPSVADDYALLDYGNGTYRATFTLSTASTSLDVSARILDSRSVFVMANATLALQ